MSLLRDEVLYLRRLEEDLPYGAPIYLLVRADLLKVS